MLNVHVRKPNYSKVYHRGKLLLASLRSLCLLLNTSPFAWPFFILVFVGDE